MQIRYPEAMTIDPNNPTWWMVVLCSLFGAVALAGAFRAMFRDRSFGRARCPKCRYDLTGNNGDRCTECGHAWSAQSELFRTHRHPWIAAAWLILAIPGLTLIALHFREPLRKAWYALPPRWITTFTMQSGDVKVIAARHRDPMERLGRIEVRFHGATIFEHEDALVDVGVYEASKRYERAFTDFNRDGIEELFVYGYSGGAHCCWTYAIIELTVPPRIVAQIGATSGIGAVTVGDDEVLLNIPDTSFDYWRTSFVDSPRIPVLYRLKDGHLEIAIDHMLTERPSPDAPEWKRMTEGFRAAKTPDPRMWEMMLKLSYGGHEDLSRRLFEESWPVGVEGKADFIREFDDILQADVSWKNFSAALKAHRERTPAPPSAFHQPM